MFNIYSSGKNVPCPKHKLKTDDAHLPRGIQHKLNILTTQLTISNTATGTKAVSRTALSLRSHTSCKVGTTSERQALQRQLIIVFNFSFISTKNDCRGGSTVYMCRGTRGEDRDDFRSHFSFPCGFQRFNSGCRICGEDGFARRDDMPVHKTISKPFLISLSAFSPSPQRRINLALSNVVNMSVNYRQSGFNRVLTCLFKTISGPASTAP